MADVIIKGMEMPESCYGCDLANFFTDETPYCRRRMRAVNRKVGRPDWCPLRPAPEWRSTITDPPKPGQVITFMGFGETTGSGMLLDKMQVVFWKPIPEPPEGGDGDGS